MKKLLKNSIGLKQNELQDPEKPAFEFIYTGKTTEWLFKNILNNTNLVNNDQYQIFSDKTTNKEYFIYNKKDNIFFVSLPIWYAFYIENGLSKEPMEEWFKYQINTNLELKPKTITLLELLVSDKAEKLNPEDINKKALLKTLSDNEDLNNVDFLEVEKIKKETRSNNIFKKISRWLIRIIAK